MIIFIGIWNGLSFLPSRYRMSWVLLFHSHSQTNILVYLYVLSIPCCSSFARVMRRNKRSLLCCFLYNFPCSKMNLNPFGSKTKTLTLHFLYFFNAILPVTRISASTIDNTAKQLLVVCETETDDQLILKTARKTKNFSLSFEQLWAYGASSMEWNGK